MAATVSAGVRYAPEDPTLPKPWKGLVDGKTGYLYFWNPETNVTQYERPASSSVHVQKTSQGYHASSSKDDDDRYTRVGNVGSVKVSSGAGNTQGSRSGPDHDVQKSTVGAGVTNGYFPSAAGNTLSAESYRKRHEISVTGEGVPPPLMSFDSTGFPSEILREVRYLLQEGAKCRTLWWPLLEALIFLKCPHSLGQFYEGLSESSKFVADCC